MYSKEPWCSGHGDLITLPGSATYSVTLGRLFNLSEFGIPILRANSTHLEGLNKITLIRHVAQPEKIVGTQQVIPSARNTEHIDILQERVFY